MKTKLEDWKQIEVAPDYYVSTLGRVMSKTPHRIKPKILGIRLNPSGYPMVYMQLSFQKYITVDTHRLVAKAFIPNPENKAEVNHKNGIKTDNRVENLEWVTKQENIRHRISTGIWKYKVPLSRVNEVIERNKNGETQKQLAREFGCSQGTINRVVNFQGWGIQNLI